MEVNTHDLEVARAGRHLQWVERQHLTADLARHPFGGVLREQWLGEHRSSLLRTSRFDQPGEGAGCRLRFRRQARKGDLPQTITVGEIPKRGMVGHQGTASATRKLAREVGVELRKLGEERSGARLISQRLGHGARHHGEPLGV